MIVLLIGAPGAGKGTQSDLLADRRGYRKISTGDAFRRQIKQKTAIGKLAESYISEGKLVPNEVLLQVLQAELGSDSKERILLDGYPRNVQQARDLGTTLSGVHRVSVAVHLDLELNELVRRLSGRRVCADCGATYHVENKPTRSDGVCDKCSGVVSQRVDDMADKVKVRLDVYEKETTPVLDFYKSQSLYERVDGSMKSENVYSEIERILERFE